ncbi:MAG: putative molybdenum carrier protein [Magnetococcales bacterium]|nr:putative molybdenum carrier protein [Magnetococcales bacterium]
MIVGKIVSGGQTGVDRAALDCALRLSLPCGGWCPRRRMAEDGPIPNVYPLQETPQEDYVQRTLWNVRDSDATLALCRGELTGGTAAAVYHAIEMGKPIHIVDLNAVQHGLKEVCDGLRLWLEQRKIATLNIAGPRESERPGIQAQALAFLLQLFGGAAPSAPGKRSLQSACS